MSEHNHTPEGWGYGQTGQPGYGKPFQRPFSHPERQQPAFGEPAQPYNRYATPQQQGQYGQPVQFGQPQYNQTPGTKRVSKRKAQRQTGLKLAGGFLANSCN